MGPVQVDKSQATEHPGETDVEDVFATLTAAGRDCQMLKVSALQLSRALYLMIYK